MNLDWPEIPASEEGRYPFYATSRSASGRPTVVPFAMLDREPAANPWRLYLWFWRAILPRWAAPRRAPRRAALG